MDPKNVVIHQHYLGGGFGRRLESDMVVPAVAAAKAVGKGVVINATAEDGVIEGIEHPGYRFCLGVQWHPEYLIDPGDGRILEAFVAAAA